MTANKLQPTEVIGDDLPILKWQTKRIMQNCSYQVQTKNEYVQWVTGDVNRTSLTSITQEQAVRIMRRQTGDDQSTTENWAKFDKDNPQHKVILSLLYTAQWTTHKENYGEVPDLDRLSNFLQTKSPVKKKLMDMEPGEIEKLIVALKGVIKSTFK